MMVSLGVARPEFHHGIGYMAVCSICSLTLCLRRCCSSVQVLLIHAIGSNDYTAMHGLRKHMPITHITFLVGCLAIAGIIPFAGFFSRMRFSLLASATRLCGMCGCRL